MEPLGPNNLHYHGTHPNMPVQQPQTYPAVQQAGVPLPSAPYQQYWAPGCYPVQRPFAPAPPQQPGQNPRPPHHMYLNPMHMPGLNQPAVDPRAGFFALEQQPYANQTNWRSGPSSAPFTAQRSGHQPTLRPTMSRKDEAVAIRQILGKTANRPRPYRPEGDIAGGGSGGAKPPNGNFRRAKEGNRGDLSLVLLIKSLLHKKVVIELRNDIILRGMLDDVDNYMNLVLSAATQQTVSGTTAAYEVMYVKGRNIRYVHMPRTLDPAKSIEAYRRRVVADQREAAKERARNMNEARLAKGASEYDPHADEGLAGPGPATSTADVDSGQGLVESQTLPQGSHVQYAWHQHGDEDEGDDLYYSSSGGEGEQES